MKNMENMEKSKSTSFSSKSSCVEYTEDENKIREQAGSRFIWYRKKAAENPFCPNDILEILADDDDWEIQKIIAERKDISENLLKKLSESKKWVTRNTIASRDDISEEIIDNLSKDSEWMVRNTVSKNPIFPKNKKIELSNASSSGYYENFTGDIDFISKTDKKISGSVENAVFRIRMNDYHYPIIWHSGTWLDGTWEGAWYGGIWKSGTWEKGVWLDGTWESGEWKNGIWRTGKDRFGNIHSSNPSQWK